jgi:hypothetical protein
MNIIEYGSYFYNENILNLFSLKIICVNEIIYLFYYISSYVSTNIKSNNNKVNYKKRKRNINKIFISKKDELGFLKNKKIKIYDY